MADKYIFNYEWESRLNEKVNHTFKVNNHKISGAIYYKLARKVRKNYERLTLYKVLWTNFETNSDMYSEYETFKRSIK